MGVLKAMFSFLWDTLYFLTGEGSWFFRPHEKIVIEAAIASLPDHIQMLLRTQLKQITFVQRSHKQVSRPRFYSNFYTQDRKAIEDDEFFNKLLNVQIDVGGEKQSAQVEFYQGRIDSIQFKQPAKFYVGKVINVMGVKPGKPSLSHAAAIDRCEHGREH